MARIRDESWLLDNTRLPVRIYSEWRSNRRISIGKKGVHIRLPLTVTLSNNAPWRKWALLWLTQQFHKNPILKTRFTSPDIRPSQIVRTTHKTYQLQNFEISQRKHPIGKVVKNNITIQGGSNFFENEDQRSLQRVIEKSISKDQHDWLANKVETLNKRFYNKPYRKVLIKHNSSNWGSCSSSGNINISFRTLLTPNEIIDYVIVHELAHLSEMNHGIRFWNLVEQAIPDYKTKDKWLRTTGRQVHLKFENPIN